MDLFRPPTLPFATIPNPDFRTCCSRFRPGSPRLWNVLAGVFPERAVFRPCVPSPSAPPHALHQHFQFSSAKGRQQPALRSLGMFLPPLFFRFEFFNFLRWLSDSGAAEQIPPGRNPRQRQGPSGNTPRIT